MGSAYNAQEYLNLTDAEEYLEFFDLAFDEAVVQVNRLHILKRYANNLQTADLDLKPTNESAQWPEGYKNALADAYATLAGSSAVEQKLFKVFNDPVPGVVTLDQISDEG